jgi:hypothetical protein
MSSVAVPLKVITTNTVENTSRDVKRRDAVTG